MGLILLCCGKLMNAKTKYPAAFLNRMRTKLNVEFSEFMESMEQAPPVSVRLNPFKKNKEFDGDEKVPWSDNGRYLKERPSFTFDPLFHAGTYYVQEASSMFIEQVWRQINLRGKSVRVLDMCAAPGGKTTHLLSMMDGKGLLVSNEVIPNRNKILRHNVVKWGAANCIVTQNKTEDFASFESYFDVILVDAPCSGEGLFRKDKDAISEWSEENVKMCSVRQKEILKQIIQCLKPGGFLIYSTCTFEDEENDSLMADSGYRSMELEFRNFGQVKTRHGFQFYPHKLKGEGFYLSVLQKDGDSANDRIQKSKIGDARSNYLQEFLDKPDNHYEIVKDDAVYAIPKDVYPDFNFLEKKLYIRHAGIYMGNVKGNDFLPSHDLAMSVDLRKDLPAVDLDYEEAISFLRCETPRIKSETRGWVLAKYQSMSLGWMKVMDGRINNYFPKDWRILKRQ